MGDGRFVPLEVEEVTCVSGCAKLPCSCVAKIFANEEGNGA